jgi:hypothetical protein
MSVEAIVRQVEASGVSIYVEGDCLLLRGRGARVTEDVRTLLREHRVEILELLRSRPATHVGKSGELVIPFDSDKRFHWWKARDLDELAERFRAARIAAGLPPDPTEGSDA